MTNKQQLSCASCETKQCREGADCFDRAKEHKKLYENPKIAELHRTAAAIEAKHYGRATRLEEIMLFAKQLGIKKIGMAYCTGLSEEAKILNEILGRGFEVASVCCKVCGISKDDLRLPQIHPEKSESSCNPAGQAQLLNEAKTELNIICGLCVGHDAIFAMLSEAPVTTFIVKDRTLAHNPVGALYSRYIRRRFAEEKDGYRQ